MEVFGLRSTKHGGDRKEKDGAASWGPDERKGGWDGRGDRKADVKGTGLKEFPGCSHLPEGDEVTG